MCFQLEQLPGFVLQKKRENQSEVKVEKTKMLYFICYSPDIDLSLSYRSNNSTLSPPDRKHMHLSLLDGNYTWRNTLF